MASGGALAGLRRFAASRNGKLALGGTAVAGVVTAGLMSRKRNSGDPDLIPYSEVQGTAPGVNSGAFPSLEATGVSVGELEGLYAQVGALAERVDALRDPGNLTPPSPQPVPMPIFGRGAPPAPQRSSTKTTPTGTGGYPKGLAPTFRYTVKAGDTLSGIASRFKLPGGYRELLVWNTAVKDPNKIRTGQVLIVPKR